MKTLNKIFLIAVLTFGWGTSSFASTGTLECTFEGGKLSLDKDSLLAHPGGVLANSGRFNGLPIWIQAISLKDKPGFARFKFALADSATPSSMAIVESLLDLHKPFFRAYVGHEKLQVTCQ